MRLDKYLKVSRLIKRRTVANEVADAGRILINGKIAKASQAVKAGDVIEAVSYTHLWRTRHGPAAPAFPVGWAALPVYADSQPSVHCCRPPDLSLIHI